MYDELNAFQFLLVRLRDFSYYLLLNNLFPFNSFWCD